MTTVLLALAAALAYGSSDFIGGLVSRRGSAWSVAVVVQLSSAVVATVAALVLGGAPSAADLTWAVLGGVGSGVGVGFLFRGLGSGRMAVVAPVSAVGAALLPVAVGILLTGWPPLAVVLAVATGIPGIWLVSRVADAPDPAGAHGGSRGSGLTDGLLAGVGFGVLFAALDQVSDGAGLWATATTQAASTVTAAGLAVATGSVWWPLPRTIWAAAWAGPLSSVALLCFLMATQQGSLTVAALLSSLYPATTIVLAVLALRERIHRAQLLGLLLCGVTVGLVAVG
ncbi:EamA family transporter [Nocardioides sp. HDW12B]|uniref:EamA family transporter n=1 Tax=Nocardioides sp. HDW12B TaxID=2714939 RepID=UPI00140BC7B9|nr:EamA family transporter [Nocardioides sp. HDW12B]QIK66777.1 EamA family transporter [Nocardioides sp. HDW12B]